MQYWQSMNRTAREVAVVVGGAGSLAAAVLHLATIPFGAEGLRYFGAHQRLVELAETGSSIPLLATGAIAAALGTAGVYARAQIGWGRPLPCQQLIYVTITAIYVVRGMALLPQLVLHVFDVDIGPAREIVFSAVALTLGLLHIPGIRSSVVPARQALL